MEEASVKPRGMEAAERVARTVLMEASGP